MAFLCIIAWPFLQMYSSPSQNQSSMTYAPYTVKKIPVPYPATLTHPKTHHYSLSQNAGNSACMLHQCCWHYAPNRARFRGPKLRKTSSSEDSNALKQARVPTRHGHVSHALQILPVWNRDPCLNLAQAGCLENQLSTWDE